MKLSAHICAGCKIAMHLRHWHTVQPVFKGNESGFCDWLLHFWPKNTHETPVNWWCDCAQLIGQSAVCQWRIGWLRAGYLCCFWRKTCRRLTWTLPWKIKTPAPRAQRLCQAQVWDRAHSHWIRKSLSLHGAPLPNQGLASAPRCPQFLTFNIDQ